MAEKKKNTNTKEMEKKINSEGNSAKKTPVSTKKKENKVVNDGYSTKTTKQVTTSKKQNSAVSKKKPSTSKENKVHKKMEESIKNPSKKTKENLKEVDQKPLLKIDTTSDTKKSDKKSNDKKKIFKRKIVSKNKVKGKEIKKNPKKNKETTAKTEKLEKRNPFAKLVEKLKRKDKIEKKENKGKKVKKVLPKKENKKVKSTKKKINHKDKKRKKQKSKNSNSKLRMGLKKIGSFFKRVGSKANQNAKKVLGLVKKGASHLKFKSIKKKKIVDSPIKEKENKEIKEKSLESTDKKNKKLEIPEEELQKKNKRKKKRIRRLIFLSIFLLVFAILLMIPYGLGTYHSEASNRILDVPKFVKLKEECCSYNATFSTLRSTWSLQKDLEEMIKNYDVLDCDGKTYYYNPTENYTITEYGIHKGILFNEVYINYGAGNSCDIDTKFKKLELLAERFTLEDAIKDGNYVMDGDKIYNEEVYDKFMANVKKQTPSTLRIVTSTEDGDVIITDLEYLKGGKYRVSYDGTRDRNSKNHNSIIAYKFDHLKVYKNKLYAYNGDKLKTKNAKKYEAYYLLTLPKE